MNIFKNLFRLSFVLFLFILTGCGGGQTEVPQDFVKTFEGKIDNSIEVCMKLTCKGGIIEGRYFDIDYCKELSISGTLSKFGDIRLDDEGDPETGYQRTFIGKFNGDNKIEGICKGSGDFYLISTNSSYETEKRNCGESYMDDASDDRETSSGDNFGANANSVMASSYGITYSPENVYDRSLTTWWSPETRNKSGCWISLEFEGKKPVYGINIHGGSHYPSFKNMGDLYPKNLRIKEAKVVFSDDSYEFVTLDDIDQIQEIRFSSPHICDGLTLYPLSYYPSEKWPDVCISHLTPAFQ